MSMIWPSDRPSPVLGCVEVVASLSEYVGTSIPLESSSKSSQDLLVSTIHVYVEDAVTLAAVGHVYFVIGLPDVSCNSVRSLPFGQQLVSTGGQEDEYLIPWLEVTAAGVFIIPGFLCFLGLAEVVCNEVLKFGEAFLHEHDVRDDALRGLWACYP